MFIISGILGGHNFRDSDKTLDDAKKNLVERIRNWEDVHVGPCDHVMIESRGRKLFYQTVRLPSVAVEFQLGNVQ